MNSRFFWIMGVGVLLTVTGVEFSAAQGALEIRRNILDQQKAQLKSQEREADRCVRNARNKQSARDFEGNLNQVPRIDLTNCARRLRAVTRSLVSLGRQAAPLERDAKLLAEVSKRYLMNEEKSRLKRATTPED